VVKVQVWVRVVQLLVDGSTVFKHWANMLDTLFSLITFGLVEWHSDSALCPISEVNLRRAGLVLGWVTACGQINHLGSRYVTICLGQLSLPFLLGR